MSSIWFATPDIADMNRQMENTAIIYRLNSGTALNVRGRWR